MTYKLLLLPQGSVLPEDIRPLVNTEADFLQRMSAGADDEALIMVSTRELQLLVEYRDVLDIELRAVIGVSGAMYSTVWNTYAATMDRVSLDALRLEVKDENDERSKAGIAAVVSPGRIDRLARLELAPRSAQTPRTDEADGDFSSDGGPA